MQQKSAAIDNDIENYWDSELTTSIGNFRFLTSVGFYLAACYKSKGLLMFACIILQGSKMLVYHNY